VNARAEGGAINAAGRAGAFSVAPFTRAHIVRPRSVLSVPAPETKMKVIFGVAIFDR